ncbi:MAG: ribosome maturation factor RimM [Cellulomonadaceae bacterium]|jgi:16S rRNA processing protein RimM|nr:ribosome maturation factor RimM [Cellulomonadaceae bacterium]
MELVVAQIGRPHGVRGEVILDVRTDDPAARLPVGVELTTSPSEAGPLTILSRREYQGRWVVRFVEAPDRTAVEELRGVKIVTEADTSDEPDAWYPHELEGLRVELGDGTVVGTVLALEHMPAHDVLVIRETTGERTLVPFVHAIVPVVDVPGGRVVLDPPGGLLASVPGVSGDAGEDAGEGAGEDAGREAGDDAHNDAAGSTP